MGREAGIAFDADKIRMEIARQGFTIRSFEEKCGYEHPMVVRTLTRGRCRPTTLNVFAQCLGLPVTEFMVNETQEMKVMLDEGAKLPTRAHEWDAGYDLYARESVTIGKGQAHPFDTGVHVQIPAGYVGFVKSKSGLNMVGIQSEGVIDAGYTGSICVKLYNHGQRAVRIHEGQKISQLVILPIITPELVVVDHLEETERGNGGFGSTGKF